MCVRARLLTDAHQLREKDGNGDIARLQEIDTDIWLTVGRPKGVAKRTRNAPLLRLLDEEVQGEFRLLFVSVAPCPPMRCH